MHFPLCQHDASARRRLPARGGQGVQPSASSMMHRPLALSTVVPAGICPRWGRNIPLCGQVVLCVQHRSTAAAQQQQQQPQQQGPAPVPALPLHPVTVPMPPGHGGPTTEQRIAGGKATMAGPHGWGCPHCVLRDLGTRSRPTQPGQAMEDCRLATQQPPPSTVTTFPRCGGVPRELLTAMLLTCLVASGKLWESYAANCCC